MKFSVKSFFRKKPRRKDKTVRTVYFGIRLRILALLTVVMVAILSFTAVIMYQHQKSIIQDEKSSNAEVLTKILAGPAEIYLDRNLEATDGEAEIKSELIGKEVSNFKAYNPDIIKILITDERGRVRYSTDRKEYGANLKKLAYVERGINLPEGSLEIYDPYDDPAFMKSMKKKKWEPFIAVIHPVYLKSGLSTEILADFAKYYPAYAKSSSKAAKAEIIAKLVSKYKDALGEDFFPKPVAVKKTSARKAPAKKKNEISSLQKKDEIVPSADIDFIFHRMFVRVLKLRGRGELMEKASLVSDSWLFDLKNKQQEARDNDLLSRQNEISGEIAAKMTDLSRLLEKSRKLGSISIVFSTNRIEKERQKILSSIIIPFIGPVKGTHFVLALFFVMALAFIVVLHFMVKNLKKLEKWALEVGEGNLGKRIEITSRDEIGRLGDVFNRMIDEIIQKYHLEKFVSKSTKSMIARHGANGAKIDLGVNQRKNMAFIFSDVRGFTSFSENNDPETVINVLNTYLELQSCIVKENRGDIDDYVGDQIMAHFSGERRADAAIETALKIMRAIRRTNESRKAQGLPVFEVGIGVHGGEVVTGNVGSEFRMDFTCVGDAVNLTSRLCSNAAADEILVSQELFLQATKKHAHEIIAPLAVKGKREPIPVVRLKV